MKHALATVAMVTALASFVANAETFRAAKANQYIAARSDAWLDRNNEHRKGNCLSCHSTFPVMLTSMVKEPATPAMDRTRARVREMIEDRVARWEAPQNATRAWYEQPTKIKGSISTESVLNATSLVFADLGAGRSELTQPAKRAVDIMMKQQQPDGSWAPLDWNLQPWESGEARTWTTTMAMIALGTAPAATTANAATQAKLQKSREYMKSQIVEPKTSLHDRLLIGWADAKVGGVLDASQRAQIVAATFAQQNPDGGFAADKMTGFKKVSEDLTVENPRAGKSDAYATGLALIALIQSGVATSDPRVKKAVEWLKSNQNSDGSWPADPLHRDEAFNRGIVADAGAGYAKLALDLAGEWKVDEAPATTQPTTVPAVPVVPRSSQRPGH